MNRRLCRLSGDGAAAGIAWWTSALKLKKQTALPRREGGWLPFIASTSGHRRRADGARDSLAFDLTQAWM